MDTDAAHLAFNRRRFTAGSAKDGIMAYKPGDFFLGVIDFLAVLVPGIILLMLQGGRLFEIYPMASPYKNPGLWFPFLVVAYVLGQFLFAIGDRFINRFHDGRRKDLDLPVSEYNRLHALGVNLSSKPMNDLRREERNDLFHRAFSRVRMNGGETLTEVESQAANSKLFRSLVIVFALDAILSLIPGAWTASGFFAMERIRVIVSGASALGAYFRFTHLRNWTEGLALEYAVLIGDDFHGEDTA